MDTCKNVAILTGATGGLGYAFLKELEKNGYDEIWAIGRNKKRLEELVDEFGSVIVPLRLDLTQSSELESLGDKIVSEKPHISLLINNAGIAQMKASKDLTTAEIESTIDLNCKAPTIITNFCLPYMQKGSKIINVCSAAAFQPLPYLNLYASTKVFLRSYSRAMNKELKPYGISVTAVCPGWIDTDFLIKVLNGKKVKFGGLVLPDRVAKSAMKAAKKGKDMSVCTAYVKCEHFWAKLLPQKLVMKIWLKGIKKYIKNENY